MPKASTATVVAPCTAEMYVAPVGTAFPTASTAVAAPWTSIGYYKSDPTLGVEIDNTDVTASNACSPVRSLITSRTFSWEIEQAQFTKLTIEHFFGAGTWAASGTGERWTPNAALAAVEKAFLFDMIDPLGSRTLRILHPRVAFLPSGDIEWVVDDLVVMPVTATALAPASGAEIFIDASPALVAA